MAILPVSGIEDRLKALMTRSLAGDAAAHRDLLTALATHLRAYFRGRLHSDDADVEDLVQETLLAIHLKRETFEVDEPITAWIFAIARHKLIDWYRRRHPGLVTSLDDTDEVFVEDGNEKVGAAEDLARLLSELPARQATAIRCMKLEGLSAAETAARTGQSVAAVKVDVHRGLKRLARRMRDLLT
jgi:RNA polymerase sigma-70 factor, ECF subfamily